MEHYRIFIIILVGILFLLFSFFVGVWVGFLIACLLFYVPFLIWGGSLGLVIGLIFIILKLSNSNRSYLKSLFIFVPVAFATIYIGMQPLNLVKDFTDWIWGIEFDKGFAVSILGCVIFGFLFSRLLPPLQEGVTQTQ